MFDTLMNWLIFCFIYFIVYNVGSIFSSSLYHLVQTTYRFSICSVLLLLLSLKLAVPVLLILRKLLSRIILTSSFQLLHDALVLQEAIWVLANFARHQFEFEEQTQTSCRKDCNFLK